MFVSARDFSRALRSLSSNGYSSCKIRGSSPKACRLFYGTTEVVP